jgi:hypothetical protein
LKDPCNHVASLSFFFFLRLTSFVKNIMHVTVISSLLPYQHSPLNVHPRLQKLETTRAQNKVDLGDKKNGTVANTYVTVGQGPNSYVVGVSILQLFLRRIIFLTVILVLNNRSFRVSIRQTRFLVLIDQGKKGMTPERANSNSNPKPRCHWDVGSHRAGEYRPLHKAFFFSFE